MSHLDFCLPGFSSVTRSNLIVRDFAIPTNGMAQEIKIPEGVYQASVQVQGAGGSGSVPTLGVVPIGVAVLGIGAGGGGGGFTESSFPVRPKQKYSIEVGTGGASAGAAQGTNGLAGTVSTFTGHGITLVGNGGGGATGLTGGAGGTSSGGNVTYTGQTGQRGGLAGLFALGSFGMGGGSPLGSQGGFAASFDETAVVITPSQTGTSPGAGGGGGLAVQPPESGVLTSAGGAGANGFVRVSYVVSSTQSC